MGMKDDNYKTPTCNHHPETCSCMHKNLDSHKNTNKDLEISIANHLVIFNKSNKGKSKEHYFIGGYLAAIKSLSK